LGHRARLVRVVMQRPAKPCNARSIPTLASTEQACASPVQRNVLFSREIAAVSALIISNKRPYSLRLDRQLKALSSSPGCADLGACQSRVLDIASGRISPAIFQPVSPHHRVRACDLNSLVAITVPGSAAQPVLLGPARARRERLSIIRQRSENEFCRETVPTSSSSATDSTMTSSHNCKLLAENCGSPPRNAPLVHPLPAPARAARNLGGQILRALEAAVRGIRRHLRATGQR